MDSSWISPLLASDLYPVAALQFAIERDCPLGGNCELLPVEGGNRLKITWPEGVTPADVRREGLGFANAALRAAAEHWARSRIA